MEMNMFLQEGVCLSPPFPKTDSVCHDLNRTVVTDGYYHEMHRFECLDFSTVNSQKSLISEYEKRYNRIKNCSHKWDAAEMKILMKPIEEMELTNGWH